MTTTDITAWRLLDIVMGLLLLIVSGMMSWNITKTIAHGEALAGIAANRFTSSDGLAVWQEISNIRERLAAVPTEIPPLWFKSEVDDLENAIQRLDDRLRRIEAKSQ
jgi:hypothetical protein